MDVRIDPSVFENEKKKKKIGREIGNEMNEM